MENVGSPNHGNYLQGYTLSTLEYQNLNVQGTRKKISGRYSKKQANHKLHRLFLWREMASNEYYETLNFFEAPSVTLI
jgi:hypothetical protein